MIININEIPGWKKDTWKITSAGNYAHFIAKNKTDKDVKLFLTDSGGKGNNWRIKVGISNEMWKHKNISRQPFEDKDKALIYAAKWMQENPNVKWRKNEKPHLIQEDGSFIQYP